MKQRCFKDAFGFGIFNNSHARVYPSKMLRFEARGLRVNSALPSSLLLLLFFLLHFNVVLLSQYMFHNLKKPAL
jgi:hypothetical protein